MSDKGPQQRRTRHYPAFYERLVLLHRTIGNMLIAVGAILPAFGGAFSRMGVPGALYISELSGAILLFIGFLRATTPMVEGLPSRRARAKPEGAA